MFKVIQVDDPYVMSASMFPQQHAANIAYIQENLYRYNENLNASAVAHIQQHNQVYQNLNYSDIARKVRQIDERSTGIFDLNQIRPLQSIDDFAAANPLEQRIIMASLEIRELRQNNKIDGFYGVYNDLEPKAVGESHNDHRAIWDGHIEEIGDNTVVRHYSVDEFDGALEFASDQKFKAREIQRIAVELARQGFDITNTYGGEVGK